MTNEAIIQIYAVVSTVIFSFFRLKVLMLFFQQEEYTKNWFISLVFDKCKLIDKKLVLMVALLWILSSIDKNFIYLLIPLFIAFGLYENNFLKKAKKQLKLTYRVKRILSVTMILTIVLAVALSFYSNFAMVIAVIELLPFILVLGNEILSPAEHRIQQQFLNEAKEILKKYNPKVIGITGSFGKTSTKHILGHILSGNLSVLFTPGSVNTEMGICRIVREKLQPEHKYFIVEMGAYFKGSIKRLCNFVNPSDGIITSIGDCHYEYFKTKETIASTKFELGECVKQNGGTLIINTDQIEERFIPNDMNLVKIGKGQDIFVDNIKQERDGLHFDYHNDGEVYPIFAPIFGGHQAQNIAMAITLASRLGMSMSVIISMLTTLPQINHRLEVKQNENGVTIIDDAYNSNPSGFKSAVDLLGTLKTTRSILVTPGMVELGERHDEEHLKIGKYVGERVDIILSILTDRIATFRSGFKETAGDKQEFIELHTFAEATDWMQKNTKSGDVVLLENDLPDIYESDLSL